MDDPLVPIIIKETVEEQARRVKRDGYWTHKEMARTNLEVVRTVSNVLTVVLQFAILGKVFGWY